MRLPVLFSTDTIIAADKPAGLAVIPGRGESDSVLEMLGRQLSLPSSGTIDPRVRVVHRLDKDTSGVVLYALNSAAQRHLSSQFLDHSVRKEYLALVAGAPEENEGLIQQPIAPHPNNEKCMIVTRHGRIAITRWRVEERFGRWTLLRVFPQTGKTHQIRVHLKFIGLPLAFDPLYHPEANAAGGIFLSMFKTRYRPNRGEQERPLISRLTLHAARLTFRLPDNNEQVVESSPPRDLRATISQLSKHARR